jgi:iron complex transport system substrate-binding protein
MSTEVAEGADSAAINQNKHKRIVSFAPSCTELLQFVDASPDVVGVCKYCDQAQLSKDVQIVGDFNSPNIERLARVKPDLILTVNGQEMLSNTLQKNHFAVITLQNKQLSDVGENLIKLGKITNHQLLAEQRAKSFEKAIAELRAITIAAARKKPRAFFCVWPQPLLTAGQGSFINDAITACGGINIAEGISAAYPHFSLEKLVLSDPDLIIMPFEAKSEAFLQRQPWTSLRACKEKHIYFLPKIENDRLSRPSVGVIDGLCWLAKCFNPGRAAQLDDWLIRSRERLGRL